MSPEDEELSKVISYLLTGMEIRGISCALGVAAMEVMIRIASESNPEEVAAGRALALEAYDRIVVPK